MKIYLLFVYAVSTVASLGSGPYLPSGWKPKGPAFLLPSETEKAADRTDTSSESEASSSDFLREYGPPQSQDVFQALTRQALPDLSTEKPFAVENNVIEEQITVRTESEASDEVRSNIFQRINDKVDEVNKINVDNDNIEAANSEESLDDEEENNKIIQAEEVTTRRIEESSSFVNETNSYDVATESSVVEADTVVTDEIMIVTEESIVKEDTLAEDAVETNQSDANENTLSNIKEDTAEEINVRLHESSKSVNGDQILSLGFKEYGPPKTDPNGNSDITDNSENRRRRFSSKFLVNKH